MSLTKYITSALLLAGGTLAQFSCSFGSDNGNGGMGYGYGSVSKTTTTSIVAAVVTSPVAAVATSSAISMSPAPSGTVHVHVVQVSNKNINLKFEPNNIKAEAGSTVQFQFYPRNHSVVQSTFDQPCQSINNTQSNVTGFFSGFIPVAAGGEMSIYTIKVNNTKPLWFYCSQGKHCQADMVGVINAPAANQSRTIETFAALAKSAPANLSPGEMSGAPASDSGSRLSTMTMDMPLTVTSVVAVTPSRTSTSMSSAAAAAQVTANAAPWSMVSWSNDRHVAAALGGCVVGAVALVVRSDYILGKTRRPGMGL